jgi:hypothetical protein
VRARVAVTDRDFRSARTKVRQDGGLHNAAPGGLRRERRRGRRREEVAAAAYRGAAQGVPRRHQGRHDQVVRAGHGAVAEEGPALQVGDQPVREEGAVPQRAGHERAPRRLRRGAGGGGRPPVGHEHGPDRGEHDHARGHLRARPHRELPGLVSSASSMVLRRPLAVIEWRRRGVVCRWRGCVTVGFAI